MADKGFLITFEGIDGAGKSTVVAGLQALSEKMKLEPEQEKGSVGGSGKKAGENAGNSICPADFLRRAVFTREPSRETLTGKAVYAAIASDIDPLAELFLFVADHAAHLSDVVRPEMQAGKIVISDRYADSRCAYQGVTLASVIPNPDKDKTGISDEENALTFVRRIHEPWTVTPDLTFLFDIDPAVSVARCGSRGEKTKFEKTAFLAAVRRNFGLIRQNEPERFCVIDASQPPEVILKIVTEKIGELVEG